MCTHSTWPACKMQILTPWRWGVAWDPAFLTSSRRRSLFAAPGNTLGVAGPRRLSLLCSWVPRGWSLIWGKGRGDSVWQGTALLLQCRRLKASHVSFLSLSFSIWIQKGLGKHCRASSRSHWSSGRNTKPLGIKNLQFLESPREDWLTYIDQSWFEKGTFMYLLIHTCAWSAQKGETGGKSEKYPVCAFKVLPVWYGSSCKNGGVQGRAQ